MKLFGVFTVVEPTYIGYKLYDLHSNPDLYPNASFFQFVVTGGIAVVIRVFVLVFAIKCYRNFDKGLRNQVFLRQQSLSVTSPTEYVKPLCEGCCSCC
jgi:hypothetical protein